MIICAGNFRDRTKTEPEKEDLGSQILKRQSDTGGSHSAGFEAWMRSRGKENMKVFTADDAAEQFGVVRSSYEGVPLPKIKAFHVRVQNQSIPQLRFPCVLSRSLSLSLIVCRSPTRQRPGCDMN